jgi:hypothetical protein
VASASAAAAAVEALRAARAAAPLLPLLRGTPRGAAAVAITQPSAQQARR